MRQILFVLLTMLLCSTTAFSAQIDLSNLTATGTFMNGVDNITDGYVPYEGYNWMSSESTYFKAYDGDLEEIVFDLGDLYKVDDMLLSVDNNDTYYMEYLNEASGLWVNLFTIQNEYGEIYGGLDTMTTYEGGEYVAGIDFASVETRYLKFWADPANDSSVGDRNFAIGEIQAFGEIVQNGQTPPVPEPSTMLLLGIGIAGIAWAGRRRNR
ncbi:PEP-CTERM sorting domain-containing protein [Pseudodesulfovibrio thermohalotolerans]|uniref:PEP-CTERM sorting domain-containing protein n=1 Tax=Pseudodesulfovibrio thermohalotolerans TaxID=2880651 RepID=UPI0022BA0925|nr:PEP-CTERM sorting domain-containing protein [Pseudodesulfovibrio thermohalotolerans]WFS61971.1 PEP-CTERM sorting domain-containing protein [Pseudodesulfovibrio thermohalotolerans]